MTRGLLDDVFDGRLVRDVVVFDQVVDVWIAPNTLEHQRRRSLGVGAILDADVIRALMLLPRDARIPAVDVNPLSRLVLEEVASIHVRFEGETLTRLADLPLDMQGIVKHARAWHDVEAVSLLRTHAPRVVLGDKSLVRRVLRDAPDDIGAAHCEGAQIVVDRAPGRRWLRPSWQRWLAAEAVYSAYLGS